VESVISPILPSKVRSFARFAEAKLSKQNPGELVGTERELPTNEGTAGLLRSLSGGKLLTERSTQ